MKLLELIIAFFKWLTSRKTYDATPEGQDDIAKKKAEEAAKKTDAEVANVQKSITSGDADEVAKSMRKHGLLILSLLFLTGCGTISTAACDYMGSQHAYVSIPAKTGCAVGSVVGIPAAIISLPVTWPLATNSTGHAPAGMAYLLAPWAVFAMPPAAVFGYLPAQIAGDNQ